MKRIVTQNDHGISKASHVRSTSHDFPFFLKGIPEISNLMGAMETHGQLNRIDPYH